MFLTCFSYLEKKCYGVVQLSGREAEMTECGLLFKNWKIFMSSLCHFNNLRYQYVFERKYVVLLLGLR